MKILVYVLAVWLALPAFAQDAYQNHQQLTNALKTLQSTYPNATQLLSVGKSAGGKDLWMLRIGGANADDKPGLAVVAGVHGPHVVGSELALGFAQKLLNGSKTDSIQQLLAAHTFYIFPNVNPDASEQYFGNLRYERLGNARPTDNDRDGSVDEDPFEDLNNDGHISMMRVASPTGEWMPHPADPRVMIKADRDKGESGSYHLFTEGIDNDKDGQFNEDGPGGINFNENLSYDYKPFLPHSGEFPVSETETRGVLDFLFERWNIYGILTFGPSDNLSTPLTYKSGHDAQRVIKGILKEDAAINAMLSDQYKKTTGQKAKGSGSTSPGGFAAWGYFHYGRLSLSTPAWYVPEFKMPEDSLAKAQILPNDDNNPEVNFLRWAESQNVENVFIPWTEVEHPDFLNKVVEVGGLVPFKMLNPPYALVDSLIDAHSDFILQMSDMRPQLQLVDHKMESLDKNVYRITATVFNAGQLPTATTLGQRNVWVRKVRTEISLTDKQQLIGGKRILLEDRLTAGQSITYTWLVQGKGKIGLKTTAPQGGSNEIEIDLK